MSREQELEAQLAVARAEATQMRAFLADNHSMMKTMGELLMSPFPGEDAAIAQLSSGKSFCERSIKQYLTQRLLIAKFTTGTPAPQEALPKVPSLR